MLKLEIAVSLSYSKLPLLSKVVDVGCITWLTTPFPIDSATAVMVLSAR